jgi:hypothetical protein
MSNSEELQRQIDESVHLLAPEMLQQVKLAPWSDVTDLTKNVDVDVVVNNRPQREFTIISYRFPYELFEFPDDLFNDPELAFSDKNLWTAGGPLVIVKSITGESIVEGILKYLRLEAARTGKAQPQ